MKKQKSSLYECQNCGWQSSKWSGKCANCGSWESLVELKKEQISYLKGISSGTQNSLKNIALDSIKDSIKANILDSKVMESNTPAVIGNAISITHIKEESLERFSSTQSELDIVLGGGIVRGGLYLVGGAPGVGKSTLLLKVAGGLAQGLDFTESKGQDSINLQNLDSKNKSVMLSFDEVKAKHLNENKENIEFANAQGKDASPFSKAQHDENLDSMESSFKDSSENIESNFRDSINLQNLDSKNKSVMLSFDEVKAKHLNENKENIEYKNAQGKDASPFSKAQHDENLDSKNKNTESKFKNSKVNMESKMQDSKENAQITESANIPPQPPRKGGGEYNLDSIKANLDSKESRHTELERSESEVSNIESANAQNKDASPFSKAQHDENLDSKNENTESKSANTLSFNGEQGGGNKKNKSVMLSFNEVKAKHLKDTNIESRNLDSKENTQFTESINTQNKDSKNENLKIDSMESKFKDSKKNIESNFKDSKKIQNLDSIKNAQNKDASPFSKAQHDENLDSINPQNLDSKNENTQYKSQVSPNPKRVLYVSGEESLSQIRNRAARCGSLSPNLYLLSEINIDEIRESLLNGGFEVCIIDSIQTLYSPALNAAPGSISQVREITFELMRLAKNLNIAIFIIGHITKDGQIAGPRVLEHMVDCVLYFEGEKNSELKILRGFKNRFGTTSEIGIFEMCENGLISATEATKKFFNAKRDMPGSAAVAIMEGSRCIVVEIQALTCENEYGVPKRLSNGFDSNRLNMLLALLEKKMGINLHRHDVFINVAGGIKISEPSADLAVIASILSSYKNRALKSSTAFLGEVSLIGDIRDISALELRLKELENFGFKKAIIPGFSASATKFAKNYKGSIKCIPADDVAKIIEWM